MKAPVFEKLDRIINNWFSKPFIRQLEQQQSFLLSMQERKMTVTEGLEIIDKLLAEERKCNILA